MDIVQAKKLLDKCIRDELHDQAFGGKRVTWQRKNGTIVAYGYFAGAWTIVYGNNWYFNGSAGESLSSCGHTCNIKVRRYKDWNIHE